MSFNAIKSLLFGVGLLLIAVIGAQAHATPQFKFKFGSFGSGDGQFNADFRSPLSTNIFCGWSRDIPGFFGFSWVEC